MDDVTEKGMQGDAQLISCPICGSMNWSGLLACHVCGYPFAGDAVTKEKRPPAPPRRKYRKRPNGRGSITEITSRPLRNRFKASVSLPSVYDEKTGKAVRPRKLVGYFPTYEDAQRALDDYLLTPYSLDAAKMSFADTYALWSRTAFPTMAKNTVNGKQVAYRASAPLHDAQFAKLQLFQLQACLDGLAETRTYAVLFRIVILWRELYDYAINTLGIVSKNVAQGVNVQKYREKKGKTVTRPVFTADEMQRLWDGLKDDKYCSLPLMLCYTGLRVGELCALLKADVHLDAQYLEVKKSKTAAGVRVVPICDKALPLFRLWMDDGHETLIVGRRGNALTQNIIRWVWDPVMQETGMLHRTHDGRHSFVSSLQVANIPLPMIDLVIGHASNNLTTSTYTHYPLSEMLAAVNKAFPRDAP